MTANEIKGQIFTSGFNLIEAAARIGVTKVELSHTIHRRRPYPEIRKALASLLKKPLHELFPETKRRKRKSG